MKTIRQSKIDAMQALIENEHQLEEINRKFDQIIIQIKELTEIKNKLNITNNFTAEEFEDTMDFVVALNNEDYEKLSVYKIDENQ
jgi:hypothetical protein